MGINTKPSKSLLTETLEDYTSLLKRYTILKNDTSRMILDLQRLVDDLTVSQAMRIHAAREQVYLKRLMYNLP